LTNNALLIPADEPTGELDTANAKIVVDYFAKVNKELGKTIIMVTMTQVLQEQQTESSA
jgi:ABC-type lipoprotein export system ATPase subunit